MPEYLEIIARGILSEDQYFRGEEMSGDVIVSRMKMIATIHSPDDIGEIAYWIYNLAYGKGQLDKEKEG